MTMVPSMSTVSMSLRIASTATWSEYFRSPWPMVRAQAMAAFSTTLTNSRKRSSRCISLLASALERRQLDAAGAVLPVAERVVRLHDLVDLARAFVDHGRLAVPVEAADGIFVGVAVAAVDLDRVAGRAL